MIKTPANGMHKATEFIDDKGSTRTTEHKYHTDGILSKPTRHYFEFNYKVRNIKEEHEAYLKFSEDIKSDKSKLDPAWRVEHSKRGDEGGYYICVACYTILEY